jgi:ABC-type multidrug transport system fused ATPase/permease subunit
VATGIKSYKASRRRRHSVHPLQRLFDYGHKYKRQIWLATGASVLNKVFDLAPPALIGIAVDVVVKQQDSIIAGLGIKNISGQFAILSFLTVVTWILESFFEYRYKLLWRNLGQNIQHNLRLDAYKHLQELELAYFEERSTGGLMSILNDDVNQLERFLDVGANDLIQVITTILIISSTFFILAPSVAWMAMLPMPFILGGSVAFQKLLAPRYANRHIRKRIKLWYNRIKSCTYPEIMSNIVEYIHNNPEESQRLLGLHYEQLKQLIEKAIELHNNKKELAESKKVRLILGGGGRKPKLTPESQIILTLTYLRHLTTFQLLGIQFGVSETTANDTFNYWFPLLGELLPPSLISQVKKTPTTTKL